MGARIHPTAEASDKAKIGEGTVLWHHSQVREEAVIGENCILSKNVYVDTGVRIGNNVKIQNNVSVYSGVTIEDDVMLGPGMVFTNDLYPRAFLWDESRKGKTLVKKCASIGANATIICGNRIIGEYGLVAAGSVVTKDVPDHGLVAGNPARLMGFVCRCGKKAEKEKEEQESVTMRCPECREIFKISKNDYLMFEK